MIAPRRFSRLRIAAFAAIERLAVLLGGRRLYRARHLRRERLLVRRETVEVPDLPAALDGFLVAHLTDVHAGPFLGAGDLADVVAAVEEAGPDVVCWTGDYVVHGIDNARPIEDELGRCAGARGTFAVFGNHDYLHRREPEFVAAMEPRGWTFLRNRSAVVEVPMEAGATEAGPGARVAFAGIEDPEEGKVVDVDAALADTHDADVVIALAHGPRAAPAFAAQGARVVLSGHTHATQVDLPFLRDLGPAHPGLRVELGGTTLVVGRGIGAIGAPLRSGVPAEIVLVTLRRGAGA